MEIRKYYYVCGVKTQQHIMKTIHLRDEKYNWVAFSYEDIEAIKSELESRKISIGEGASIVELFVKAQEVANG